MRHIGVVGSGDCQGCEDAYQVGKLLAQKGCLVINGGLSGVMEAVSRGARENGGQVVCIVPAKERSAANPYCSVTIATGMGHARNFIIVHSSEALIAVGGRYGTVSEMAIGLKEGKRVVALNPPVELEGLIVASTPKEAVEKALSGFSS